MNFVKKRLFVDMDGTLAEWRSKAGPEELYEKWYFESLRPYSTILGAVKGIWFATYFGLIGAELELFILSAYLPDSPWAKAEKKRWLRKYLCWTTEFGKQCPMFDASHTLLVPCGSRKVDYVPGGVSIDDYLLDDYTLNLREWEQAGGTPIKVFNGCNGKGIAVWKNSVRTNACKNVNYRILLNAMEIRAK